MISRQCTRRPAYRLTTDDDLSATKDADHEDRPHHHIRHTRPSHPLHLLVRTRKRQSRRVTAAPSHDHVTLTRPCRITEGKTRREAIRCLKRYIAREIYRIITSPPETQPSAT